MKTDALQPTDSRTGSDSESRSNATPALFGGRPNKSGGKKGSRRPSKLLAAMGWVAYKGFHSAIGAVYRL